MDVDMRKREKQEVKGNKKLGIIVMEMVEDTEKGGMFKLQNYKKILNPLSLLHPAFILLPPLTMNL